MCRSYIPPGVAVSLRAFSDISNGDPTRTIRGCGPSASLLTNNLRASNPSTTQITRRFWDYTSSLRSRVGLSLLTCSRHRNLRPSEWKSDALPTELCTSHRDAPSLWFHKPLSRQNARRLMSFRALPLLQPYHRIRAFRSGTPCYCR